VRIWFVIAAVAAAFQAGTPGDARAATDGRFFAPWSFWNARLPAHAELDPNSGRLVRELKRQVDAYGPWINTWRYTAPVYTVGRYQRTVRVKLDVRAPGGDAVEVLRDRFAAVPLPRDARPAAGSDRHLVVYQPAKDRMWEFWLLRRRADGWHARWGGYQAHVSRSPGYFTKPYPSWGATATSLPLLAGGMRIEELQNGHIPHALALAIPETRSGWYSWPAQRTDGNVANRWAIPEGARFRLDPSFDTSTIKHPVARAMARAIQKYGLVVRDRAGAVVFVAEDNTKGDGARYGVSYWTSDGIFGGEWPNVFLASRAFPWHKLQLLKMRLRPQR
jgi:hypothetical protein